ncbi:hypothetical protein IL306_004315 [Fusarium sp. DS 682]|nr:hypothetical protein IL306_004315 [Fusarium sp. DS 682]
MGQEQSLVTETEIEAPVEIVQSLFKDFPRFPEWSSWSVEPAVSSKKMDDLTPKDKLKVDVKEAKFTATLLKNDPDAFEWGGNFRPLLIGHHEFTWRPSTKTPGGTTFTQSERWTGWLVFLWRPGWIMWRNSKKCCDEFNAELKKEAEKRAAAQR